MNKLEDIQIDEVSLVDAPANPLAQVLLFKRKQDKAQPEAQPETSDVTKQATALIEQLQKRLDEAELQILKRDTERYAILGLNTDELAALLHKSKSETPKLHDELVKALDSALAAVQKSGIFDEIGKTGTRHEAESIEKYVAQIQQAQPELSYRQALDKAYLQHPELQN